MWVALRDGNDRVSLQVNRPSTMFGEGGNDTLIGGADMDSLDGGGGDDFLSGGAAIDLLDGQAGLDTLFGGNGCDVLLGQAENDMLDGGSGADVLDGGGGTSDVVNYSQRTQPLQVSLDGPVGSMTGCLGGVNLPGFSVSFSTAGANDGDWVSTGVSYGPSDPNHWKYGNTEGDNVHENVEVVWGGQGGDKLIGNGARNVLSAGPGNDWLDGGLGPDWLLGDQGTDSADYATRQNGVNVTLDGAANDGEAGENDNVETDIEHVSGGWGNDILQGNGGDNALWGGYGYGADALKGGAGADYLDGGEGNDDLDGGMGADELIDLSGADTFRAVDGRIFDTIDCGNDPTEVDTVFADIASTGTDGIINNICEDIFLSQALELPPLTQVEPKLKFP